MADSEFILHVGDQKFLITPDEAITVANILNGAPRIEEEWFKDVPMGERHVIRPPSIKAANITPMTAYLRLQIDHNMKLLEEKK